MSLPTIGRIRVLGAGGHAAVVIECARAMGWNIVAVHDDDPSLVGGNVLGARIIGPIDALEPLGDAVAVGIGANEIRAHLFARVRGMGALLPSLAHPSATVSPSVVIGDGSVILAGAIVNARAAIGAGCIVNSGAILEHDCVLEDGAHLAPGATLAGGVRVGAAAFVGMRAVVIEGVRIGAGALIAAGAVVVRDVEPGARVAGVPARPMRGVTGTR